MNDGDSYVLETKSIIFVWTGSNSNNIEKLRAARFATTLKTEHGPGCSVVIVEDGEEYSLDDEERKVFDEQLPLNRKAVKPHTKAIKDEDVGRRLAREIKLFRVSDESGSVNVTEVKSGSLL